MPTYVINQDAFNNVKTGLWTFEQFEEWLEEVREQAYTDGQNNMQEAMIG